MFRKVLLGLAVLACIAVGATALGEPWHGSHGHPSYHWSQPHYVPSPRVYVPSPRVYVPSPRVYVVPQPYLYTYPSYPSYYQPYLYTYPVYPSWGFSIQIGPRW